ncbi:MAG: sodium:calcium antiporter [Myxococcota bacterium]
MRWLPYVLAAGASVPWLATLGTGEHPADTVVAVMTGVAILGAAFLLSWACEVAEMDVPQALAVSVLALVAVLPEYAVDASFAWKAATQPEFANYAIANMTGGNRILLGGAWTLLAVIGWMRTRQNEIQLPKDMGAEIVILILATLYAIVPVMRGALSLVDTGVYLFLYVIYLIASARAEEHEVELVGPAKALEQLGTAARRLSVLALFLFAAGVIFVSAEPFAESLVHTGKALGIDEFVLVQYVAPLASESPEVVVAVLMVLRGHRATGLRTLVSSNVNQWTLLVGTLAVVYSVASGHAAELPFDARQQEEVLLTAAMAFFAVATIADRSFALWQALTLTGLFLVTVLTPHLHLYVGIAYFVMGVGILVFQPAARRGVVEAFQIFWALLTGRHKHAG